MFRTSQEIRLGGGGGGGSGSHHNNNNNSINSNNILSANNAYNNNNNRDVDCDVSVFGKYQKTRDADEYPVNDHLVFVAPELTDPSKVQLLHFPNGAIRINSNVEFIIKRNGVKGNFEVKVESPSGISSSIPLQIVDPERFKVKFNVNQAGLYKVHVKCNSVALPKSPFIVICICGNGNDAPKIQLPIFKSDASKVTCRGLGLTHMFLDDENEFTVDGSEAGNNILFVGVFGPEGQCDEVIIRHQEKNTYKVTYRVNMPGDYILAVKWGDAHIPGSPFCLSAN